MHAVQNKFSPMRAVTAVCTAGTAKRGHDLVIKKKNTYNKRYGFFAKKIAFPLRHLPHIDILKKGSDIPDKRSALAALRLNAIFQRGGQSEYPLGRLYGAEKYTDIQTNQSPMRQTAYSDACSLNYGGT